MKTFLILFLTVAALLSAEPPQKEASPLTLLDQDVIFATLLQDAKASAPRQYVLRENTSIRSLFDFRDTFGKFADGLRERANGRDPAFKEALEDFLHNNAAPTKLVFPKPLPENIQLLTADSFEKFYVARPAGKKSFGWNSFYESFPRADGIITISRPGIDAKHTIAIFYLGEQSGDLDGWGQLYILKYDGKKWVPTKDLFGPMWVS